MMNAEKWMFIWDDFIDWIFLEIGSSTCENCGHIGSAKILTTPKRKLALCEKCGDVFNQMTIDKPNSGNLSSRHIVQPYPEATMAKKPMPKPVKKPVKKGGKKC